MYPSFLSPSGWALPAEQSTEPFGILLFRFVPIFHSHSFVFRGSPTHYLFVHSETSGNDYLFLSEQSAAEEAEPLWLCGTFAAGVISIVSIVSNFIRPLRFSASAVGPDLFSGAAVQNATFSRLSLGPMRCNKSVKPCGSVYLQHLWL